MKHLQLTPPLLIITMGYPGAGKTFFARQFADLYNLARISEDRLRFELFERPQFNRDESEIISRLQEYFLEQVMQTERPVIVEGSYLQLSQRKRLFHLARQYGYRTLTVWLQTDIATSAARASNRDRRNIDSKYSFPLNKEIFERYRQRLQRPGENEVAVVISGKHAFKSQCLTVLRKIAVEYGNIDSAQEPVQPIRPIPQVVRTLPNRRMIQ